MFDHVTLQVADVDLSRVFYERLLAPLGIRAEHTDGGAVGFTGTGAGSFWICPAQGPETRELHMAFTAPDREVVYQVFTAAVAAGMGDYLRAPAVPAVPRVLLRHVRSRP